MRKIHESKGLISLFILVVLSFVITGTVYAQDEEKSIRADEFIKKRPISKLTANRTTVAKKRQYRVVKSSSIKPATPKPVKNRPAETEDALFGLTIWKMRPATNDDSSTESITEVKDGKRIVSEFTLERMESETPLRNGEKIRISVESLSHNGYLYVVDRELFSDGTYSAPKLIYPTLLTKNGQKPIASGELIFIPGETKNFVVNPTQNEKTQVAEVLTFIISPKILIEQSMLMAKAIDLPLNTFSEWTKWWEVDNTLLEEIGGAGQTITIVERSAGNDAAKGLLEESNALSQDDPTPQSIFRSQIKRGNAVMVNVSLKFKKD